MRMINLLVVIFGSVSVHALRLYLAIPPVNAD